MAYYQLSKVIKMRRDALGYSKDDFDVEGPSGMTVYRMEKGNQKVSERTYRRLTRAMGVEESTRQGVIKTTDMHALHCTNDISECFRKMDYEKVEQLQRELVAQLDMSVVRNQQFCMFVECEYNYGTGKLDNVEYEESLKELLLLGKNNNYDRIVKKWPFYEKEYQILGSLEECIRRQKKYEQQKILLENMKKLLEKEYMECNYMFGYLVWTRMRIGDVLGNMGCHREAISFDEETVQLCERELEYRYLEGVYYDIFWNYWMIKQKQTLTVQEEERCKECLLMAYYMDQTSVSPRKLYKKRVQDCYPEELLKH